MNWFSGIVIAIVIWWMVFFIVLPWHSGPMKNPPQGHDESAPEHPRIGFKFLLTTIITAVIWIPVAYLISILISR